jgi:hypothetical protein
MPGDANHPLGPNTLRLPAIFVPEGADEPDTTTLLENVGHDAVHLPAAFAPADAPSPALPFVSLGDAMFQPDAMSPPRRIVSSWQTQRPAQPAAESSGLVWRLPRTRFRRGAPPEGEAGLPPDQAGGARALRDGSPDGAVRVGSPPGPGPEDRVRPIGTAAAALRLTQAAAAHLLRRRKTTRPGVPPSPSGA